MPKPLPSHSAMHPTRRQGRSAHFTHSSRVSVAFSDRLPSCVHHGLDLVLRTWAPVCRCLFYPPLCSPCCPVSKVLTRVDISANQCLLSSMPFAAERRPPWSLPVLFFERKHSHSRPRSHSHSCPFRWMPRCPQFPRDFHRSPNLTAVVWFSVDMDSSHFFFVLCCLFLAGRWQGTTEDARHR